MDTVYCILSVIILFAVYPAIYRHDAKRYAKKKPVAERIDRPGSKPWQVGRPMGTSSIR